jgi:hypothetical protein
MSARPAVEFEIVQGPKGPQPANVRMTAQAKAAGA